MRIKHIDLLGIGGIRELHLDFNDRMNILCGPNSIGKTTVIESIASMFMYGHPTVKRNVACERGSLHAMVEVDGMIRENTIEITKFSPNENESTNSFTGLTSKILSMKVGRFFGYSKLDSVPSDLNREPYDLWNETISGISFEGVKGWFVNRYLYSAREGTLSSQQLSNFQLAEKCFSIINPQYSFSRVMGATNDIMVNTPQGEIYFEYLSSGFKSVLFLLFSSIKEIEFRFKEHNLKAEEFDGIILIDEVEIHLHPEWQEQICSILCSTFPKAQFIVTTHSPHIIQTAEPNEIIALYLDENNNVNRRTDLISGDYGYKGWTIEEILHDVMGMKTLRTDLYLNLQKEFGQAIDEENVEKAKEIYGKLDILLHPMNSQRKLMLFQLAALSA